MTSPAVAGGKSANYHCTLRGGLLVCGRMGIVEEVEFKYECATGGSGNLLIAQIYLKVHICSQMSFTVAVWRVRSLSRPVVTGETEPTVEEDEMTWGQVREEFRKRAVRFVAGEFGMLLVPLVEHMREKMMVNVAAWDRYEDTEGKKFTTDHFMRMVGPVDSLEVLKPFKDLTRDDGGQELRGDGTLAPFLRSSYHLQLSYLAPERPLLVADKKVEDWTSKWPTLPLAKQRAMKIEMTGVVKLTIVAGAKASRRSDEQAVNRSNAAFERARRTVCWRSWWPSWRH